jgi:hypothetical protein
VRREEMTLFEELKRNQAIVKACHESARKAAAGRMVRVVTDINGQPCGRSKPSQKGRIFKIVAVLLDIVHEAPTLWLESELYSGTLACSLDDVELLELNEVAA